MHKLKISLFFCLFSIISFSQKTFTIEEAKAYTLENNITIKNALANIEIAEQQIVETRGMGLPQVEINGNFNHFINLPVQVMDAKFLNPNAPDGETVSFQAGTKFSSQGTLQVGQMVFNGSYIVGLKASNFFKEFQETLTEQTKEEAIFNVIQAYQIASVAKKNLEFMDSLVYVSQIMVDNQTVIVESGMGVQEDLDQLNYSLQTAKNSKLTAENGYKNTLNMLKLAMGYDMNSEIEIVNTPDDLMAKKNISDGTIENNLSYSIMSQQLGLSELNIQNNKFQNLPTLNAFFNQTYSAYRNEFNFFDNEKWYPQTVWGLQLNVPIFSGLTRHAQTQQAKIQLMQDQNSFDQLKQSLTFQEIQLKNNLMTAKAQLELHKHNVDLARNIYKNEILKDNIGNGNSMLVTQKHNQLLYAQTQLISAMIEVFEAQLEIDKLYNNILSK